MLDELYTGDVSPLRSCLRPIYPCIYLSIYLSIHIYTYHNSVVTPPRPFALYIYIYIYIYIYVYIYIYLCIYIYTSPECMPTRNSTFCRFVSSSSSLSLSLPLLPPFPTTPPSPIAPFFPSGSICVTPPTSVRCKHAARRPAGTVQQQ